MSSHSENEIEEESSIENNDEQIEDGEAVLTLKSFLDKLNGEGRFPAGDFEFKGLIEDDEDEPINGKKNGEPPVKGEIWEKDQEEWLGILKKNQKSLTNLSKKVIDLKKFLSNNGQDTKEVKIKDKNLYNLGFFKGLSFLDVKSQLFISYLLYLFMYSLMKSQGKPIHDHPIVKRLIYLKSLLIKLKPIEKKLDYQISKLLRIVSCIFF